MNVVSNYLIVWTGVHCHSVYMFKTIFLLVLEILPVIIFFILGQSLSFRDATSIYIFMTIVSISAIWFWTRRISYLSLILGTVIVGAGSLSVWFHNPEILLLADTIYYLGAAATLLFLQLHNHNLFYTLFKHTFGMSARGWDILVYRWIIALIIVGISNELVRQFGTIPDWFMFQLIKTFLLLFFAAYQFTLTKKYRLPDETTAWGIRI